MTTNRNLLMTTKELPNFDAKVPIFADIETEALYVNCSLIQLRQTLVTYLITTDTDMEVEYVKNYMKDKHLVFWNASYDLGTLSFVPEKLDDLWIAFKIAYPECGEFTLDKAAEFMGYSHLYEGLDKKTMQNKGFVRKSYLSQSQLRYAQADVEFLELLWNDGKIQEVIKNNLAYRLAIYALRECIVWQQNGLPLLQDKVKSYLLQIESKLIEAQSKLPPGLNPRSSKQVKELFGTESSDKATLVRLVINHNNEIAEYVLAARKALNDKTKISAYLGHKKMIGRFNPVGARTSRWTCKAGDLPNGANLQNYSREYKGVFGVSPDSGFRIVSADYSTLEIRIVCAITGEMNMYKALKSGIDIHRHTASMIFNKSVAQITGKERSNSKPANFGFAYAMSAKTFIGYAFDLYGIKFTESESREIRNKWFKAYPAIGKYHEWIGRKLRHGNLILETALGYRAKPNSYTEAANLATQGTGAECGRLAIHRLTKKDVRALKYFVNFIHDSFYLIVPEDETDYWSKLLEESMVEAWFEISKSRLFKFKDIPMPVEVVTGYNMSDLSDEFEGGGQALSVEEMREAMRRRS